MADGLVELDVLLVRDVLLGTGPQRAGLVHGFPFAGLDHGAGLVVLAVLPLFLFHQDGQADVVGVLGDQLLELPAVQEFPCVFAQVQDHAGAARLAGDLLHFEVAGTGAGPAHAFAGGQAGAARFHGDLVGHDEAGVKAHAELSDQLGIGLLVARELVHEGLGTALGDGAQVLDGFLCAHADAGIGDGQRLGLVVEGDAHFQVGLVAVQAAVVQRFEAQLVAGVRGVGDQLTHEDLGVGVQRMRDQVQQLGHFSLEGMGLLAHRGSSGKYEIGVGLHRALKCGMTATPWCR